MELPPERLSADFKHKIHPVYLIHSDEILLLQENCDLIIQLARQAGFVVRERMQVENNFNWQQLLDSSNSMSLFGDKKIIDLRFNKPTPGKDGSEALCQYLENPSPDNLLLIRSPKISKENSNSKWYKAINNSGAIITIWPIKLAQLPGWIEKRLKQKNLHADREAITLLADRVEGNLLAANQEIEKLALLFEANSQISAKQVLQTVANSSRYDIFSLVDESLSGNANKAIRMYRGLLEEGMEPTVCLWAFRKDLNLLYQIHELQRKSSQQQAIAQLKVWKNRVDLMSHAAQRLNQNTVGQLLMQCATIDMVIKGQKDSALGWPDLFENLIGKIAGLKLPS